MAPIHRIVFLCGFSNSSIRNKLTLSNFKYRNIICKILHHPPYKYSDLAIWVSDYISEFETHKEYVFHVISTHQGMKKRVESFIYQGIHYHFIRKDTSLAVGLINARFRCEEKSDYSKKRRIINSIIDRINPDIIILCGAENPEYSTSVLDINNKPVYVILQTFLNSPKRIAMGVGSDYRRDVERRVFSHAGYFCTKGDDVISFITSVNSEATILPAGFPSHRPVIDVPKENVYDFVFFALDVTKNKGIEDAFIAFSKVVKDDPSVSLAVIGGCKKDYRDYLDSLVAALSIKDNVVFKGFYPSINDAYSEVAKARFALLPGITAGLNSTIREAMFLGIPVICYRSSATDSINTSGTNLLTAEIGDIESLYKFMLFALTEDKEMHKIAVSAKNYAENNFSNKVIVDKLLMNSRTIVESFANKHN